MKTAFLNYLTFLARVIVHKYDPKVIAITGSYGKTSTKEAIFAVLNTQLTETVRANEGDLNNEWGLPLTIIGAHKPASMFGWLGVLFKAMQLVLFKSAYPEVLVVEMGADKPGDIAHLLTIVTPDIAVLTGIGHTHIEFFGSPQEVAKEKFQLVTALKDDGVMVYNADDNFLSQFMADKEMRHVMTYGTSTEDTVRASQITLDLNDLTSEQFTSSDAQHIGGIGFDVAIGEHEHHAYITNVLGRSHVYAALAACAVADILNIDHDKAVEALENYKTAPGRMRLLKGIKHTILIDDTYNASPEAAALALDTLADLSCTGKKWAVLGAMLELGSETESLHNQVGKRAAELESVEYVVTVGEVGQFIATGAVDAGQDPDTVFNFDTTEDAGHFVQDRMKQGDLVLLKASRGEHFEAIVKEIMAEPQKAGELLVNH